MSLFTTSDTTSFAWPAVGLAYAPAKLGLDVKAPLLRENEEVAVAITERPFPHGLVCSIDVRSQSLAQSRVAVSSYGLQASHEVGLVVVGRDVEREPCELGRTEVNLRIQWEEAGLKLQHG